MKSTVILITAAYVFTVSRAGPIEIKSYYDPKNVIYTSQHDIVKIYASLALMEDQHAQERIVFFVEADINSDGTKVDQGSYVIVDNTTTKLLNSCRDIAGDVTGKVFFASKDGIYTYNPNDRSAYKYGDIADSFISLAVENDTGVIYALNKNQILYKITENGKKIEVDDRVKRAREIVLDMHNNLFYYDEDKNLQVLDDAGSKKIEGLPKIPTNFMLIKPPNGIEGIFLISNNVPYAAFANGTSVEKETSKLVQNHTAFSVDTSVLFFIAHEKKIYEINMIEKIMTAIMQGFVDKVSEWISNIFK